MRTYLHKARGRNRTVNLDHIDLHVHAGIERSAPMDTWIDGLIQQGRKALGLLDHYELYLKSDEEYAAYLERKGFPRWYPNGLVGFREFCRQVRHQGAIRDIQILLGLEVYHGDFPDIRPDFLDGLDFIGCHISKTESFEPWGDFLLHAASKLSRVAHQHALTGVLFHPFNHSFWSHRQGITPARGLNIIQPDRLDDFANEMASLDICIEINWGSDAKNLDQPIFLQEYLPVIEALRERQVRFWLGSDVHRSLDAPYNMNYLCSELGISIKDVWNPFISGFE